MREVDSSRDSFVKRVKKNRRWHFRKDNGIGELIYVGEIEEG